MKNYIIALLAYTFIWFGAITQTKSPIPVINSNDTLANYILSDINVLASGEAYRKQYNNTKYYVLQVYDYAMLASAMLQEFEDSLSKIDSKKQQNKYIKEVNEYLKNEFGEEISDMSITRGMYLMKIIHKETGLTTFDIIKSYQNGLKAMWWQSVVSVFGTSLKYEYQPEGEDAIMAIVIQEIEDGKLTPVKRAAKTVKAQQTLSKKEQKKADKSLKKLAKKSQK